MMDFWHFHFTPLDTYKVIEGEYDYFLVLLSFIISFLAAYALLVVLERAWKSKTKKTLLLWNIFGSIVFGLGVWAMHFTGMLAFMLPLTMHLNVELTLLSVFFPMIGAYFSLQRLAKECFTLASIHWSALFLALGIGSMHFTGMEAMMVDAVMLYHPPLLVLSLIIAYLLATIAINLIKKFNSSATRVLITKVFCAIAMGSSVTFMHYTAMSAVSFHTKIDIITNGPVINDHAIILSLIITGIIFIIVVTTIFCALIEDKLSTASQTVEDSEVREKNIVEHMSDGLLTINSLGIIESINCSGEAIFDSKRELIIGSNICTVMKIEQINKTSSNILYDVLEDFLGQTLVIDGIKNIDDIFPIEVTFSKISIQNEYIFNCIARDITQRITLENQLRQAQKLESIGQLSAGIAHEINTPMQFVGDNLNFIADSTKGFMNYQKQLELIIHSVNQSELTEQLNQAKQQFDIEFLEEETPQAIDQSIDGVARVSKIVSAMKEFSHPGKENKQKIDINKSIESTTIVARNEWKFLADLQLDFTDDLPKVNCFPGEINQVILNMIVNACHAIKDSTQGKEKGHILISTLAGEGKIIIEIKDDGAGMDKKTVERVFDPFFTTKEIGQGTGQGLSLAYAVIVEKHAGEISVESTPDNGTTFTIRLPI